MTFTEQTKDSVTILGLAGRLDATTGPEADQKLAALIDGGVHRLVIDLGGVDYVSSAGLRVILATAKRMQRVQGTLAVANLTAQVRQIFDASGFASILSVYPTVAEALAKCAPVPAAPAEEPAAASDEAAGALSLAEEVFLLALDGRRGDLGGIEPVRNVAFASALLMELALSDRIDTDTEKLTIVSTKPTGNVLLDEALKTLADDPESLSIGSALDRLAGVPGILEERILEGLVKKGILRVENQRVLWLFEIRRYPIIDSREIKEVRSRLRDLILSDEVPDARDVVLIALGRACNLLQDLFSSSEYDEALPRIATLARLDFIGQELTRSVQTIGATLAMVSSGLML